jgi:homocysteine S-methyltransferase
MPNAGLPRFVGGRYLYLSSPEYMAEFAVKAMDLGVAAVGGCCGTTAEHIQAMAHAVAGRVPQPPKAATRPGATEAAAVQTASAYSSAPDSPPFTVLPSRPPSRVRALRALGGGSRFRRDHPREE